MANTSLGGSRQRPDIIDKIHEEYLSTYPSFISCKQQAVDKPQASSNKLESFKHRGPRSRKHGVTSKTTSLKL